MMISLFGNRLLRAVNAIRFLCFIFKYFFFESIKRIVKESESETKSFNSLRLPFLQQILKGWSVTDMTWENRERPIDGKYKGKKGWRRKQFLLACFMFVYSSPAVLSFSLALFISIDFCTFDVSPQTNRSISSINHTVTIST